MDLCLVLKQGAMRNLVLRSKCCMMMNDIFCILFKYGVTCNVSIRFIYICAF